MERENSQRGFIKVIVRLYGARQAGLGIASLPVLAFFLFFSFFQEKNRRVPRTNQRRPPSYRKYRRQILRYFRFFKVKCFCYVQLCDLKFGARDMIYAGAKKPQIPKLYTEPETYARTTTVVWEPEILLTNDFWYFVGELNRILRLSSLQVSPTTHLER